MVGRAQSERQKRRAQTKIVDHYMGHAVKIYQDRQKENPLSLTKVCQLAEQQCLLDTQKVIKLSDSTLHRRIHGGRSHTEAKEEQRWLNDAETEALIQEVIYYAERGFPLDHHRLKEHADEIARQRHGDAFPKDGVGKSWTSRFASDHKDRIGMYWTHAMDKSRARAINAYNHEHYFGLLGRTVEGQGGDDIIPPELTYGTDESGLQKGVGLKTRGFGAAGKKIQHQQRSGDRENITVIVTICGDGSSLAPAAIYKGEGFQVKWKQDNPLNMSLGYSKKGYIDGEIGQAWIENFDRQTKVKANGRRRLLLVDGHSSHYTRGFLQYAREHKIEVLGYLSHSTHVYQGLDVVIFSVMKRNWTKVRDRWEREGHTVDKTNFLSVYAEVHNLTLTTDNILSAFEKTGVIPFNPGVVTAEMMAPSTVSSTRTTVPIQQEEAVQFMTEMVMDYVDHQAALYAATQERTQESHDEGTTERNTAPSTPIYIRSAVTSLASTSASPLLCQTPIKPSFKPPSFRPNTISPKKPARYSHLLEVPARTAHERALHDALVESSERDESRKNAMMGMQAGVILSNIYVSQAQKQLQSYEKKKDSKGKSRLMGDGKAKLFSGDDFFNACLEHERQLQEDAAEKEKNRQAKDAYAESLSKWKAENEAIRARNDEKKQRFEWAVEAWEKEKEVAKQERRKPRWSKPKWREDYKPEKMKPRPKLADFGGAAADSSDSETDVDNVDD